MITRGMVYCMASQVFGGATNATMASSNTMTLRPANNRQSARASGSLALPAGSDAGVPDEDARKSRRSFAPENANHQARIEAANHTAATAPRVSRDPALNSSVVTATQIPHKVAETMKLARQSCPRRHSAAQHPAKARKGRTA